MKTNTLLITGLFLLCLIFLLSTCTKQEVQEPTVDQPISVSITVDGRTSTEAAVR